MFFVISQIIDRTYIGPSGNTLEFLKQVIRNSNSDSLVWRKLDCNETILKYRLGPLTKISYCLCRWILHTNDMVTKKNPNY